MTTALRARPTIYKGIQMRSRLEADFAAHLDRIGCRWEYEPVCFGSDAGIECDPARKADNPVCGCSRVFLGWHPSAGEARQAWIGHVDGIVALNTVSETLRVSDRVAGLEQLARDLLSRYEDEGFAPVSQAKFREWEAILRGSPS